TGVLQAVHTTAAQIDSQLMIPGAAAPRRAPRRAPRPMAMAVNWVVKASKLCNLVTCGEQLELKCGIRSRATSECQNERDQDGHHRPEAYRLSTATSTVATRTAFSAGTSPTSPARGR